MTDRPGDHRTHQHNGRGELRILLGAAPGVGKTYAMLREGQRLREEGRDVVIGLLETHGRSETEAQVGDLEVVPRKAVPYRSIALEEMDVDAIVARNPEIVLVDELAHTNAPGSRFPKRYQDVEVLRDHGIDVLTTLNIQHVSELQDLVLGITGVEVQETVPDKILDDATDIQLVDLPIEVLIRRLEQGKIYPAARADKALTSFFRAGNLTALRELALRRTAAEVDERLADLMSPGLNQLSAASERIMVLVDPHRHWADVLRSAWRLASGLHGELVALVLAPDGNVDLIADLDREEMKRQLQFAEDLGARPRVMSDRSGETSDRIDAIVRAIRQERITVCVLGVHADKPRGWFGKRRLDGSELAEAVLIQTDGVDIHLVRMSDRA
ncbi:MAG: sensor histidine kinase KdpD [Chloroflexia bacterium]|nr:sensor histidine kinase KdpD [Chloroflexia bacterium]